MRESPQNIVAPPCDGAEITQKPRCIVLTGAPFAGKTTIGSELKRRLAGKLLFVPEVPTLFLDGGLPLGGWREVTSNPDSDARFSTEIVALRCELEQRFGQVAALCGVQGLLCDRGLLDAAAYTSPQFPTYFALTGRMLEADLCRYDAVVQLGTLAHLHGSGFGTRPHDPSREVALEIELKLKEVWSKHQRFYFLPASANFESQVQNAQYLVEQILRNA